MIRKWLKDRLPKKEELTSNSQLTWLGSALHGFNSWHLNRRSVSRGFAAGVFAAFIPLPIQMLSAVLLSILWRGNILVAAAATWISNPITFIPLNYLIYKVGKFITHDAGEYHDVMAFDLEGKDWNQVMTLFLDWIESLGKPFIIGSLVVAVSSAIIGYILINILWKFAIAWEWKNRSKYPK